MVGLLTPFLGIYIYMWSWTTIVYRLRPRSSAPLGCFLQVILICSYMEMECGGIFQIENDLWKSLFLLRCHFCNNFRLINIHN